jgi:hypothetical protein
MRIRPSHVALVLAGVILGLGGFLLAFRAADYALGMTTVTVAKKIRPDPETVIQVRQSQPRTVTETVTETRVVTRKANVDQLQRVLPAALPGGEWPRSELEGQ